MSRILRTILIILFCSFTTCAQTISSKLSYLQEQEKRDSTAPQLHTTDECLGGLEFGGGESDSVKEHHTNLKSYSAQKLSS